MCFRVIFSYYFGGGALLPSPIIIFGLLCSVLHPVSAPGLYDGHRSPRPQALDPPRLCAPRPGQISSTPAGGLMVRATPQACAGVTHPGGWPGGLGSPGALCRAAVRLQAPYAVKP